MSNVTLRTMERIRAQNVRKDCSATLSGTAVDVGGVVLLTKDNGAADSSQDRSRNQNPRHLLYKSTYSGPKEFHHPKYSLQECWSVSMSFCMHGVSDPGLKRYRYTGSEQQQKHRCGTNGNVLQHWCTYRIDRVQGEFRLLG